MNIVCIEGSFSDWIASRLSRLNVRQDTNAYVVGVLDGMKHGENDLSGQSLVLAYYDAVFSHDFRQFQQIGDYILWGEIFVPQSFDEHELVMTLGRRSYRECWRLLRGQWYLYDELAERFPEISHEVRSAFVPFAKNHF